MQLLALSDAFAEGGGRYSIPGATYRNPEQIKKNIIAIKADDDPAFNEKLDILGNGKWRRAYIGKYGSKKKAEKDAENLKRKKVADNYRNQEVTLPAITGAGQKTKTKKTIPEVPLIHPVSSATLNKSKQATKVSRPVKNNNGAASGGIEDILTKDGEQKKAARASEHYAGFTGDGQAETKEIEAAEQPIKKAMKAIQAGRYDHALEMLKEQTSGSSLDPLLREKAQRLMADCLYFPGIRDSRQLLLAAVEQYKTLLQRYPDPASDNEVVYYHMAKSYEKLKFYYEAVGALERLIATYPDSGLMPEAMFMLGNIFRQAGKFSRAIDRLTAYLKEYPDGTYAKMAYFAMGDCYYRMKQVDFARKWFDEARKKWPEFSDIPRDILFNIGSHDFEMEKYKGAFYALSLYISLYPDDEFSKDALYKTARIAEESGQASLALKLYSLFIGKYPLTGEAENCALSMANIGVSNPGIRLLYLDSASIDNYLNPLYVYDRILKKYPDGGQAANVLLLKANALEKYGKAREAVATHVELLSRFPRSSCSGESRKNLKTLTGILVDNCYEKGDYAAVSDLYFKCYGKGLLILDDFKNAIRIGESLREIGLYNEAGEVYVALKSIYKDRENENRLTLVLAEIDVARGKYGDAEEKLVDLFKGGAVRESKTINGVKRALADVYYKKGLFEKAASLYSAVISASVEPEGTAIYKNYGHALLAINMKQAAIANYLKALKDSEQHPKNYNADAIVEIYTGLGDAYYGERRYREGLAMYQQAMTHVSDDDNKRWLRYRIGEGYARMDDFTAAEKSFAQLKEMEKGEFWPKIADYGVENSKSKGRTTE